YGSGYATLAAGRVTHRVRGNELHPDGSMEDEAEGEQARAERRVRERLALEPDGAPRSALGLDEVLNPINGDVRDRELANVRTEMPLGERAVVVQHARPDRVERRVPTEPLLSDRG